MLRPQRLLRRAQRTPGLVGGGASAPGRPRVAGRKARRQQRHARPDIISKSTWRGKPQSAVLRPLCAQHATYITKGSLHARATSDVHARPHTGGASPADAPLQRHMKPEHLRSPAPQLARFVDVACVHPGNLPSPHVPVLPLPDSSAHLKQDTPPHLHHARLGGSAGHTASRNTHARDEHLAAAAGAACDNRTRRNLVSRTGGVPRSESTQPTRRRACERTSEWPLTPLLAVWRCQRVMPDSQPLAHLVRRRNPPSGSLRNNAAPHLTSHIARQSERSDLHHVPHNHHHHHHHHETREEKGEGRKPGPGTRVQKED